MKFFKSLIVIICSSFAAKAQLAVITDPAGNANVRDAKSAKSKVKGALSSNTIVLFNPEDDGKDWVWIAYSKENSIDFESINSSSSRNQKYLTGFVHKSRITPIDRLPKATYKKGIGYLVPNSETGQNDTVFFSIKTKAFNQRQHHISKSKDDCVNCSKLFVDKIDGRKPWGIDGEVPSTEIASISLHINKIKVEIPLKAYKDLFELGADLSVNYDKGANIYLYKPLNSDGAGSYSVVWIINNGALIKRYIDCGD